MSEFDPALPHVPTASERLRNLYRSGDEETTAPDNGEAFSGLVKRRRAERPEDRKPLPGAGDVGPDGARTISERKDN